MCCGAMLCSLDVQMAFANCLPGLLMDRGGWLGDGDHLDSVGIG